VSAAALALLPADNGKDGVTLLTAMCKNHLGETSILLFGKSHLEEADENQNKGCL
jgi:hypothetical protein